MGRIRALGFIEKLVGKEKVAIKVYLGYLVDEEGTRTRMDLDSYVR